MSCSNWRDNDRNYPLAIIRAFPLIFFSSGEENKRDSPTPSSSTVVNKSASVAASDNLKSDQGKPRPRHLKQRASKANSGECK
jgi:hypothetical protein